MEKQKESVFSKVPDYGYREDAPVIDAGEFQKVIDSRRSVRVFEKIPIPEDIVKKCLHNALLAPNSSNLQPAEFYWIRNEEKKKSVVAACLSQPAARYAAELFIVVARTGTWKKHAKEMVHIFSAAKNENLASAINYYKKLVPMAYSTGPFNVFGVIKKIAAFLIGMVRPMVREPASKADVKVWAVKSTALAAENLMLSLRAYGYDSCPMEGLDSKRIKKILGLQRDAVVVMAVGAGKRGEKGIYGPRLRFDASRYIHEV